MSNERLVRDKVADEGGHQAAVSLPTTSHFLLLCLWKRGLFLFSHTLQTLFSVDENVSAQSSRAHVSG